jgi:hypothetical protein
MILIVNKVQREYPEGISLPELIKAEEPEIGDPRDVLCALNGTLVRPPYNYVLSDMDSVQIAPVPAGG